MKSTSAALLFLCTLPTGGLRADEKTATPPATENKEAKDPTAPAPPEKVLKTYPTADGKLKFIVDTTLAPDLTEWAEKKLIPVVWDMDPAGLPGWPPSG